VEWVEEVWRSKPLLLLLLLLPQPFLPPPSLPLPLLPHRLPIFAVGRNAAAKLFLSMLPNTSQRS
jgi:hypothetical protein